MRAHPLGVAIANEQFNHLDKWIVQKNIFAKKFIERLSGYNFLSMPFYDENSVPSWYAFVMNYKEECANGVDKEQFIAALIAEGLVEVDCPNSTRPVHSFPLFTSTNEIMPRLYPQNFMQMDSEEYNEANKFYRSAIKIPVWAFKEDDNIVDLYIKGFEKVCDCIVNYPEKFK